MNSTLTIVTPAESYDLTVVATVKAELGITTDDEDSAIQTWIRQASGAIATYCNRVFAQESLSEQFRLAKFADSLVLSRYPVTSIGSITEDDVELDEEEYELHAESGIVKRLSDDEKIAWSTRKVVVAYDAGYELLSGLPHAIERAAILLVKHYRFSARRDSLVKSVDIADVQRTVYFGGAPGGSSLPPEVEQLIEKYRKPSIF